MTCRSDTCGNCRWWEPLPVVSALGRCAKYKEIAGKEHPGTGFDWGTTCPRHEPKKEAR